jgi:hypothetical protein
MEENKLFIGLSVGFTFIVLGVVLYLLLRKKNDSKLTKKQINLTFTPTSFNKAQTFTNSNSVIPKYTQGIKRDVNGFSQTMPMYNGKVIMPLYLIEDGDSCYLSWSGSMTTQSTQSWTIAFPTFFMSDPNNDIQDIVKKYFKNTSTFVFFLVNDCGTYRQAQFSLFPDGTVRIVPYYDCSIPNSNPVICDLSIDSKNPAGGNWFTNCGVDNQNTTITISAGFWKLK